jgi:hypothetical protein
MDYRSLTALAIRLAGVLILVSGIAQIPNTFVNLYVYAGRDALSPAIFPIIFATITAASGPLIIGVLIIYFPSLVVNRVLNVDSLGPEGSVQYRDLQALAFSVLGLYFFSSGIFDAAYWIGKGRIYFHLVEAAALGFPRPPAMGPDEVGGLFAAGLQILAGLGLFFGGRGLVRLLQRARGTGDADR